MNFFSGMINGMREIWAHKFRSLLSMSGIILGVAALVAMVGVVQGMLLQVKNAFEGSGGIRKLEVTSQEVPIEQQARKFLSPGRTNLDAEALERAVPLLRLVVPVVSNGWEGVGYEKNRHWNRIVGSTPDYGVMNRYELKSGRFIGDLDIENYSQVIVIPERLSEDLFGKDVDAIGKEVEIKDIMFTVIGVAESGEMIDWGKQRTSIVPISVIQKRFTGDDKLTELSVQVYDTRDMDTVITQVENVLLQTHNGIEDFAVQTQEEQLAEFRKIESSFTFGLGGIACITLFVGGLGIMNVMLAVINERIREIGVRKAVGARDFDIFTQFVAEAVVIATIGGVLGIFLSVGIVDILKRIIPENAGTVLLSPGAMVAGFTFSVVIGMLAGIYPAFKAAALDVIEALRYE